MKTGFIGCGNMGGTLAAAAAKAVGGQDILLYDPDNSKTEALRDAYGCVITDLETLAAESGVIFLGVKPQVLRSAAAELRPLLRERADKPLIVSMAVGVTAASVSEMLDGARVMRIMPNIPVAVGAGVIFYATDGGATAADVEVFTRLMDGAGILLEIPESKIDAGSALTSCGPAFVCLFAEAMTDAGIRLGFTHEDAQRLSLQMIHGTAKYSLDTGKEPAAFRAAVCSPAGSTIEGIAVLEKAGVRAAIMEAVQTSYERNLALGK